MQPHFSPSIFRQLVLRIFLITVTKESIRLHSQPTSRRMLGLDFVVRPADVQFQDRNIWRQDFRHAAENVVFKLTAFEDDESLDNFEKHARRLLDHTSLTALIWANIGRRVVTFSTLRKKA